MKQISFNLLKGLIGIYLLICFFIFLGQEKLLFHPEKTDLSFTYNIPVDHEEIWITQEDGIKTHALYFKVKESKGIVLYFHGNAGSLSTWNKEALLFTNLGYDVMMPDYRGFGKSEGAISDENQLYTDNQEVYNWVKSKYSEDQISVLGYSLGSAIASKITADNQPKRLILQAPYYSMKELSKEKTKIFPGFLVKYPLNTHNFLENSNVPVYILHGENDKVIPLHHAEKLEHALKDRITLFKLPNQGHNRIGKHPSYRRILEENIFNTDMMCEN